VPPSSCETLPKVSLVVVNYNGRQYLRECVRSLLATSYPNFDVVLVDNGSSDGSVDSLGGLLQDPRIRVLRLRSNLGYGRACNLGADQASGEILAFLNNDLVFRNDWLDSLISVFRRDPTVGAIQPKLVMRDDPKRLDAAGGFIDIFGCAHERRGVSIAWPNPDGVFYAKGAAIAVPSNLFSRLGRFDEDFFLYYEETDLCWRIWLSGHRVLYVPDSVVFHVRAGTTRSPDRARAVDMYTMARVNRFRMILKNYEAKYLLAFMPVILLNHFKDMLLLIVLGAHYSAVLATLEVPWRILKDMRKIVVKRRLVQRLRRVSSGKLIGRVILLASPVFVPHEFAYLHLSRKHKFRPAAKNAWSSNPEHPRGKV